MLMKGDKLDITMADWKDNGGYTRGYTGGLWTRARENWFGVEVRKMSWRGFQGLKVFPNALVV